MNAQVVATQPLSLAQTNSARANALVPTSMSEAMQLADIMASAGLLPDHLRGKPGDCLLVIMQAQRWGMDAVSVAQSTSVVHGKLCYEGKLVAAALYAMGAVEGRLHYEISGHGQGASIIVTGTPRGSMGAQSVSGAVKDWRTYGKDKQGNRIDNAWDKMPEDMLVYRGTRQWARRYAPEALLGVYTPDEMEEAPAEVRATVMVSQPGRSTYSDDDFSKNLPKWRDLIESGRKSASEIIALVESKAMLSDAQRAIIAAYEIHEGVIK
ncbi:recombinase RecT [Dyella caseinilytica]|uniref:Recombinase RecT n=1 Tax=Dyella caseinilytica TaxID=1849581 RepID=A0ABX7GZ54_9GAMM|nr:recombinase RecT [Dyella caseinilytica]QRN55218.1 recombinase RecT [Dyella caseinilytica]GGA00178.1 hypothetical protein GCM10011408_21310 [Dyella caseinilytica]